MYAKALICDENQNFSYADVILPEPDREDIVIRTLCSGVSIGTEFALIRNKISWGSYPMCTGYQGVGVVERVGGDVLGFRVGDKVYHRHNRKIQLTNGENVSAASGAHCSTVVTQTTGTHGVALITRRCRRGTRQPIRDARRWLERGRYGESANGRCRRCLRFGADWARCHRRLQSSGVHRCRNRHRPRPIGDCPKTGRGLHYQRCNSGCERGSAEACSRRCRCRF